jgi:hypothetical protein
VAVVWRNVKVTVVRINVKVAVVWRNR